MIDIGKILKRSWHILWNYRVLWIFGILLVLVGGARGGDNIRYTFGNNGNNGNNNNGSNPNFQPGPFINEANDWFNQNINPLFDNPELHISTLIWIGVGLLLFILFMILVTSLIRYPAETALIRMVDEYEQTGTKMGFKQGWKLGWNRRAFRMWVIDLVISIPAMLFFAFLLGIGLLFFFSVVNGNQALAIAGTITAIGCAFLFIFTFVILMVVLGLLRHFFVRTAALEGTGIGESFRSGWSMFRRNWKSAGLMWLVMLGVGIGAGIVSTILFFLLIPAYLILLLPAVLVAVIPAAIAFGITSIFASGTIAWIVAALVALPFLVVIATAPMTLIGGWYAIYSSSVWTLTYRELKALEAIKPEELPAEIA